MFNTKAKAWQYEQERRLVVELKDCAVADGMYFYSFIPIHLRQVIIGSRSQIRRPYIQHLLSRYDYPDHVEVKVAGPHPDKYEIRLKD